MSTDRQMEAARATAARDAAQHGQPVRPVGALSNWEIFKSAFHRDNPLHQHNRRWGVFLLASAAGLSYLVMLAEEKQRHMDMDRARNAAAAHAGQPATAHAHPPMPRK